MKDEYIIINKTKLLKELDEFEKSPLFNRGKISTILKVLKDSTPLIPEIENAYNAGVIHNSLALSFDNPKSRYFSKLTLKL